MIRRLAAIAAAALAAAMLLPAQATPQIDEGRVDFEHVHQLTENEVHVIEPAAASPGVTFAGFNAMVPTRILDTRTGVGASATPVGAGASISLQVTGIAGIPANATAVILNVTATGASTTSFITVWPAGEPRPNSSSLNTAPGITVPNLVISKLGAGGKVSLFNEVGTVHLLADAVGWARDDGHYRGLSPYRVLDTRIGVGVAAAGPVGAARSIDVQVAGTGTAPNNVPTSGVSAVVLNITAAAPTTTSFVTSWPAGEPRPNASSLNFVQNQTIPNLVIAKVGAGGKISLFNESGSVHLLADVVGWIPTGAAYVPLTPTRIMDTRTGFGGYGIPTGPYTETSAPGLNKPAGPLPGNTAWDVFTAPTIPIMGVAEVILNVTVTGPTGANGYLSVYPAATARPEASNLNFQPNQTIPNLVAVKVGPNSRFSLYNFSGTSHVLVDVVGYIPARNSADTLDTVSGAQIHVVYVVPSDATEDPDYAAKINWELTKANEWLTSVRNRIFRFDRTSGGQIEVSKLKSGLPRSAFVDTTNPFLADVAFDAVRKQMVQDGFGDNTKIYLVIPEVDTDLPTNGICGLTTFFSPTVDRNLFGPLMGLIPTINACASNSTSRAFGVADSQAPVIAHELFHALGAVPSCAPNRNQPYSGHVSTANDPQDLMAASYHLGPFTLDTDNADYYGHNRSNCYDTQNNPYLGTP